MAVRRAALLILGLAGSFFAAVVLYISVQGTPTATVPQPVAAGVRLPANVPGTTLLIERISSYEGPFLEDGSDKEVVDVAALHVFNTGSAGVLKAGITLCYGGDSYVFYGEYLPPSSTVVLLEQEAKTYCNGSITDLSGWQETAGDQPHENISVTDRFMGMLVVTNHSDKTLHNICLHYKSWLSPPEVYMGGITYRAEIPELLPGQTQCIYPNHYATGYSKVVSVTAE